MTEVAQLDSTGSIYNDRFVGDYSLQTLLSMMLADKIDNVDKQSRDEVEILTDRQKRIEFLNKYLRGLNSNTSSKDGTVKTSDLDDLKKEGLELKEDADARREKAEELREMVEELMESEEDKSQEIAKLQKQINWLEESAEEIYTLLQACDIIDNNGDAVEGPKKYTDAVRGKIVENIRSYSKMLQSRNSYQSQVVSRLNNERHEVLMLAKDMARSLHEILKRMASNLKG